MVSVIIEPKFLPHSILLLAWVSLGLGGCPGISGKNLAQAEQGAVDTKALIAKLAKLDSAGDFITLSDLGEFRPGRPKDEILKDLRWRAGYVVAAKCGEIAITAVHYTLYADGPESRRSESLYAIFVDDKFVKLIDEWPDIGNRYKIADYCGWLNGAMENKAVSIDALRKEVKSIKGPPEHVDPGLTAVYLAMRALGLAPGPPPPEKDYEKLRKNAALRDQFNAARLNIGMTEAEVQATLKAMPLESGKVEAGNYSIYGSTEAFNVSDWLCFSPFFNVLVVYRDGKAIAISSIPSGSDWRQKLEKTLVDLPKRDYVEK